MVGRAKPAPSGQEVLLKAFEESGGKTVDLIVDQEVAGVTPEIFNWWTTQIPASYKMWYPEAHLSAKIEVPPSGGPPIVMIREWVGEFDTVFRCIPSYGQGLTLITPDGKPMGGIIHEVKLSPNGMQMHSIFRFPAKTPQPFLDAMREHCKAEMQDLPGFLPELYRQHNK